MLTALFVVTLLSGAFAAPRFHSKKPAVVIGDGGMKGLKAKGAEECNACASLIGDGLDALLNAIMSTIPTDCSALCITAFPDGGAFYDTCDVICSIVGLGEFVNVLSNTDISPVWACMEFYMCPTSTCSSNCVSVQKISSTPNMTGPPNNFVFQWQLIFAAGVGTVTTDVNLLQNNSAVWGSTGLTMFISPSPGRPYLIQQDVPTEVSTSGGNICLDTGLYQSDAEVCFGMCGDTFKISGPIMGHAAGPTVKVTRGNGCR